MRRKGAVSLYLTDEQYEKILLKIRDTVYREEFKPVCCDSDQLGNKYNRTNCGFCNDGFTDQETALWPEKFPVRREMKHRRAHQVCPFDVRQFGLTIAKSPNLTGCYYHCYLFNNTRWDIQLIRLMVEATLATYKTKKALMERS